MSILTQGQLEGGVDEFLTDPLLTVAAFMLVAVCVLSILFSRLISFNLRRKAWKIRRAEDQLKAGMSAEEIQTANDKRRGLLRRWRESQAQPELETSAVEAETESFPSVEESPDYLK